MQKLFTLIIIGCVLVGCKSSLKSSYKNFNAYYNTFYNAKKSYRQGLEKSESQKRTYNTLQPLRIYQTPLGAGSADFQNAIEKGADILRKHEDTKWVDDALEIIGKSFFYKNEYFSADQKFEELYLSSEELVMKQRASFWKGRVLLELQAYNQVVQYLSDQIAEFDGNWKESREFEIKTVLAEAYIHRESWVNALDLLNESVPRLPKKEYKERGFFLIGQLNEILGNQEEAFVAYDKVSKYYTEYDLQFEAQKKKAEVARALGNSEDAYKVLSSMVRDDKNTEFVSELNFELGKTEQDRGNSEKAERIYISILRDKRTKTQPQTKAKVYNGLAEINRFEYNDYKLAAAYYDSASKVNAPANKLPEDFRAKEFAVSFGEYARIKNEIHFQDSLLWLGMLPQAQFDSVLVELEKKKRKEIERLKEEQEERRNTLINVNPNSNGNNQQANNSSNGFLSYKNPVMLAEASQQFNAIWGGRPLVDNWRVSELLVSQIQSQSNSNEESQSSNKGSTNEVFVSIDLSRVPFTLQDQDSVRGELLSLKYEMANLFFLSLNLADSAQIYFKKVIEEGPESNVAPVSLYSLSELSFIENKNEEAREYANQLVSKFPNTIYADRVTEKYGLERSVVTEEIEVLPKNKYLSITNDTSSLEQKVELLVEFEKENRTGELGELALLDVIEIYINLGKQEEDFDSKFKAWTSLNSNWKQTQKEFRMEQDSAKIWITDSLVTSTDSTYYQGMIDSTLSPPDFILPFPYRGINWDSTRSKLDLFTSNYPKSKNSFKTKALVSEFTLPIEEVLEEEPKDETVSESTLREGYLSCEEIDQELFIRGGEEAFLESIEFPSSVQEENISFQFFVNNRGIIEEFKLSSETQNQVLIDAFINGIDENLSFEPVLFEGAASAVQCNVTFTFR